MILRGHLASLKGNELQSIINLVTTGLYWYPREKVFKLLESFDHDHENTKLLFAQMIDNKTKT